MKPDQNKRSGGSTAQVKLLRSEFAAIKSVQSQFSKILFVSNLPPVCVKPAARVLAASCYTRNSCDCPCRDKALRNTVCQGYCRIGTSAHLGKVIAGMQAMIHCGMITFMSSMEHAEGAFRSGKGHCRVMAVHAEIQGCPGAASHI